MNALPWDQIIIWGIVILVTFGGTLAGWIKKYAEGRKAQLDAQRVQWDPDAQRDDATRQSSSSSTSSSQRSGSLEDIAAQRREELRRRAQQRLQQQQAPERSRPDNLNVEEHARRERAQQAYRERQEALQRRQQQDQREAQTRAEQQRQAEHLRRQNEARQKAEQARRAREQSQARRVQPDPPPGPATQPIHAAGPLAIPSSATAGGVHVIRHAGASSTTSGGIRRRLTGHDLRDAIILQEILSPPLGLRDPSGGTQ